MRTIGYGHRLLHFATTVLVYHNTETVVFKRKEIQKHQYKTFLSSILFDSWGNSLH